MYVLVWLLPGIFLQVTHIAKTQSLRGAGNMTGDTTGLLVTICLVALITGELEESIHYHHIGVVQSNSNTN